MSAKAPMSVIRNSEYVKFGFIMAGSEAEPKAQCNQCGKILQNEALKPSKLQKHLKTK